MKQTKTLAVRATLVLLVFSLLVGCFAGCDKNTVTSGEKTSAISDDFTFPLEEPVTLTFMTKKSKNSEFEKLLEENHLWQKLKEETNVNIEFQVLGDDANGKLGMLINSNSYGDAVLGQGPAFNSVEASLYLSTGKFISFTEYVNEKYMPNLTAILKENPLIQKTISSPENEIVTLPRLNGVEGAFLESPLWINKKWLDKLNLSVPKTIDEFTNVLRAFSTRDPNGNGVADEIPYLIANSLGNYSFDAFLGCWGIATKSGTNDSYVQVVNNEAVFAPTTNAYKDALKYMAQLYKEELIYQEAFTASSTTAAAKLKATTCVVGCFTSNAPPLSDYRDDYICIAPPKVPDYDPCWYYHYGINGNKNFFYVTDACKNVGVLMAWMDKLFDLENGIELESGPVGGGRVVKDDNGLFTYLELDAVTGEKLNKSNPTLKAITGIDMRAIPSSAYGTRLNYSQADLIYQNNYSIYKDILNTTPWPRPYYAAEDSRKISELSTDIFYKVSDFRAKVMTGAWDVDKKWDNYVSSLSSVGLDEFMEIQRRAYSQYDKINMTFK